MSLADRCAGSVREIQIKSGRESRRARPVIARQRPNKSSDEAHIWHTKRRREATFLGVVELLSLMRQISSHRLIQPDEAEAETCSELTGKLLHYPLVEDGCAESPDLADL